MAETADTQQQEKQAAQQPQQSTQLAPISVGAKGLVFENYDQMMRFARTLAASDLVPKDYRGNLANVLVGMQYGFEIGLSPLQAVQNIAVIGNRPSLWGDAIPALIQASGELEDMREFFEGKPYEDDFRAVCIIKRKGRSEHRVEFSVQDAKDGQLWGKAGPWQTSKKRMLQMRARAFAARDTFADVLKGIRVAEEQGDVIDITPVQGDEQAGASPATNEAPKSRTAGIVAALNAATEQTPAGEVIDMNTGEIVPAEAVVVENAKPASKPKASKAATVEATIVPAGEDASLFK